MNAARLLLPALRWRAEDGFAGQRGVIDEGLALGVGGFIVFGGESDAVSALTAELRDRSEHRLLIGADLERGAGQQFAGAVPLPPLAAIASLGDTAEVRRAASVTARDARALGVNWVYGPVADLDAEPENPIVGTRSFGSDPAKVAEMTRAWIEGCQAENVLACAKHFPGHGRTTADSHAELPVVRASRETLEEDLRPFKAAVGADVASIMTAHVAFPALDSSGLPATLSPRILEGMLRQNFGFEGLIVTDAFIMAGVRVGRSEGEASVRALAAGCDLILYAEDLAGVRGAIDGALARGELTTASLERSDSRRVRWASWASQSAGVGRPAAEDRQWAERLADRVVHVVQGSVEKIPQTLELVVVDDDIGGPFPPPSREPLRQELSARGVKLDSSAQHVLVAAFGDIRGWKGRAGYSKQAIKAVRRAVSSARERGAGVTVMQFSHPRIAAQLGVDVPVVCAWGGEEVMQRAAARWIAARKS